jgi:hypothetical protein
VQNHVLLRVARKTPTYPRAGVDCIEHSAREGADRVLRICPLLRLGRDFANNLVRGHGEQLVVVGDVLIDRARPRRQMRRQRAKGQGGLTLRVEDADRGVDDPLLRKSFRAS